MTFISLSLIVIYLAKHTEITFFFIKKIIIHNKYFDFNSIFSEKIFLILINFNK